MITLDQAKRLTKNDEIYHNVYRYSNGRPQRWRINGQVKLWKRSPERISIPLKYGLYDFSYLTENNLDEFSLTEEEALNS